MDDADKENLGVEMPATLVEQVQAAKGEPAPTGAPAESTLPAGDTTAAPATPLAAQPKDDDYEPTDIFAWANNLFQHKDQLEIELFLINKNNVVYRTKLANELTKQLRPLFIDGILDYVTTGAAEGLTIRAFEDAEAEENVLQRTRWSNAEKLQEVMVWIRTQEEEMELFIEEEHDIKRIKGVLARVNHPTFKEPFYVIKQLPKAQMLKGEGAWMIVEKTFLPFDASAALRIPADNQLLILEKDLYVFNQSKLDRLFGYNAKKASIAAKKIAEIQSHFKLAFAAGDDIQTLIKGNKALINKLQKIELTGDIKQEQMLEHAEEMGVELMQDGAGAIIIEDEKDLRKFVNLLNDDYVESNLTGVRYEIKSKKPLKPEDDEAKL